MGKATGDLYIQAFCSNRMIQSETYTIEDCRRYNPLTSNDNIWISSNASITYNSDGMYISNGNWSQIGLLDELTQDMSVEYDVTYVSNYEGYAYITSLCSDLTTWRDLITQQRIGATGHYKYEIKNNVFTLYKDNVIIYTASLTSNSFYLAIWTGNASRHCTFKDLKVKLL